MATAGAFFVLAGVANAATFFVEEGAPDTGNCTVDPCGTIQYAIGQARGSVDPENVIEVAEGDYQQNVDATHLDDDGLTILGELDPDGYPVTTISGDGGSGPTNCLGAGCIVAIGLDPIDPDPRVTVSLENVAVTQDTSIDNQTPVHLEGGSDLHTVDVFVDDEDTFAGVEYCEDPGSDIVNSYIGAFGTSARGIDGCAEIDVIDTTVFTDSGAALDVGLASPGETTEVTRSWLTSGLDPSTGAPATAFVEGNLTVDSSIISGGETALEYPGDDAEVLINNSTLDAGVPWEEDGFAVFVGRATESETTIDSSIMVDRISVEPTGADGTLTCAYTNFREFSVPDPPYTNDCPDAPEPGSTNTDADPQFLFDFPSSPDDTLWNLAPGSAAIDAGQPGAIPADISATDFLGDPRLEPGTTASCPDGVRDQGAYEAPAVSCSPPPPAQRTLTVSTTGTGTGTVTGPGIDCGGAGHADCSETVTDGATIELTASAAEGSSFDGFSGGGCSGTPCTVTMDANKSVSASFTETREATHLLEVITSGAGTGTVTGPGIDCGGGDEHTDCAQRYPAGTEVELEAEPGEDSIFARFTGGGCEANPCTVTMDSPLGVVARFQNARIPHVTFARQPERPERTPVFRLRSSQPRSTFECKVDSGEWEECAKRVELEGLDPGRHRFKARAINKFGVTGPPAKARFRVRG